MGNAGTRFLFKLEPPISQMTNPDPKRPRYLCLGLLAQSRLANRLKLELSAIPCVRFPLHVTPSQSKYCPFQCVHQTWVRSLAPEGCALFYVRPEIRDQLQLRQFGWHMVEDHLDFSRLDWQVAASARRFLFEKELGLSLYPYVLRLDPTMLGGFTPNWVISAIHPEKHLVYAVQWFLLALVVLVSMFFAIRRK